MIFFCFCGESSTTVLIGLMLTVVVVILTGLTIIIRLYQGSEIPIFQVDA